MKREACIELNHRRPHSRYQGNDVIVLASWRKLTNSRAIAEVSATPGNVTGNTQDQTPSTILLVAGRSTELVTFLQIRQGASMAREGCSSRPRAAPQL
jgi:hypothetical protein